MKKGIVFTFLVYLLVGFSEKALSSEYNILAIRVEFPFEDPDHETTSGQGIFETDTSGIERYYNPWDIPPHDKLYFENHLLALNNYWKTVSVDSVTISYKVLPEEPTGAYKMMREDKFYKYGNGRTEEQTYQKLVDLVEEAVNTCKQKEGSNIDFSSF